jgi:copper chaperone
MVAGFTLQASITPNERNAIMDQVFQVQGMSCGHCANAVTQAIKAVEPQAEVKVDLASGRVDVSGSSGERAALVQAIEEEGYTVGG